MTAAAHVLRGLRNHTLLRSLGFIRSRKANVLTTNLPLADGAVLARRGKLVTPVFAKP